MTHKFALGAVAAIAVLVLSGCTPNPNEPGPVPTVTVTVTPEPVTQPDYGFTYFHEATIGSTFEQMAAALHMPLNGYEECPHYGDVWGTVGSSVTAYIHPLTPSDGVTFFYMLESYLGSDHYPRNAEGIGIGSTVAEVLAAYPGAVQATFEDMGAGTLETITVSDPNSDSKYVFAAYPGHPVISLMQWGPGAGNGWSHLCLGG